MMLQSYIVTAEVRSLEPINVGQVVYEWPHVDWGLAGPDEILICTKLQDITTIHAVPRSCLKDNGVVQASISVGAMAGSPRPDDDARVGAGLQRQRAEPAIRPVDNAAPRRSNSIVYAAYDAEGKAVVQGSRSTFDPCGDMRIADAAWELTYARRRGVAIDDATFAHHVTGTNVILMNDDSKIVEIMQAVGDMADDMHIEQLVRGAFAELRGVAEMLRVRLQLTMEQMLQPIGMVLHCPTCGEQHIDAPENKGWFPGGECIEWDNRPHRSHLCKCCGTVWRPADVPTNGVQAAKTKGRDDDPVPLPAVKRGPSERVVALINELRREEGDDVTLLCDDPEAATRAEQCAVRCCGEWTEWREKAFMGETVLHALQVAVEAKRAAQTA